MSQNPAINNGFVAKLDKCRADGKKTEQIFERICDDNSLLYFRATKEEDIAHHIDYWVAKCKDDVSGKYYSVDVKGGRYENRIWVEIKNVKGELGWLYGRAYYIAFHMADMGMFVMVRRESLREFVEGVVEKVYVRKHEAFHKLYRRSGRLDVLTLLSYDDIARIDGVSYYSSKAI